MPVMKKIAAAPPAIHWTDTASLQFPASGHLWQFKWCQSARAAAKTTDNVAPEMKAAIVDARKTRAFQRPRPLLCVRLFIGMPCAQPFSDAMRDLEELGSFPQIEGAFAG